jgi:hypothetical protein
VELYGPDGSSCTSNITLPDTRAEHVTFLTADNAIATCGGRNPGWEPSLACLVLVPGSGWQEERLGSLRMGRVGAAVTTLPGATFLLGGDGRPNMRTSEVLLRGEVSWRKGPWLPIDTYDGCAVKISKTRFLVIHGTDIREFDMRQAGPQGISTEGWRPAHTWGRLTTWRKAHGCVAIEGRVVVAGGITTGGSHQPVLKSIELLDVSSGTVTPGPEMLQARWAFQLVVLPGRGGGRVLALGGWDGRPGWDGEDDHMWLDTVEELGPGPDGTFTWRPAAPLLGGTRTHFGALALPAELVCPA